jgi:hypothetical protein
MKPLKIAFMLLTLSIFTNCAAQNHTNRAWRFIADKWVNYGVDRDVINLGDFKDDFRQIRLRITDAPLRMYDMKIYFDNGEVQDVALKSMFRQGDESRIIDLNGGMRHLRKIEFWYETKGVRKGKARVAVWGSK